MKRIIRLFSRSDGYTFIETFIYMLMTLILSGIIYSNSSRISTYISANRDELLSHYNLLKLNLTLKSEISRVKPPWFLSGYNENLSDNRIELPYYKGVRESILILEKDEKSITLTAGNSSETFNYLDGALEFSNGFIIYRERGIKLIFPLGVIID